VKIINQRGAIMIIDRPSRCLRCDKPMLNVSRFCPQNYCSNACRVGAHLYRKRLSAKGYPDAPFTLGPWVNSLESLIDDVASGKVPPFGCVYADPPWRYDNTVTRGAASKHYATMTLDEIAALPVEKLIAKRALLWLWVVNAYLLEVKPIIVAWGFEFKATEIWDTENMGTGNYVRNQHEILLLCSRGGQITLTTDTRSMVREKRGQHSVKPRAMRDIVERNSPGPRLELFARRRVAGWTSFGNEDQTLASK
jgi:N6-adenosine-specific RNA methylase IME4